MNQPTTEYKLKPQEVHLWHTSTEISLEEEARFLRLLNQDEIERANRFRFPIHRKRFIAARGILRLLLASYANQDPAQIVFQYSARGKPYLDNPTLQFNLSHSHEMAVYALTLDAPIGVDIEKTKTEFDDAVASRFFSPEEYAGLSALPPNERALCFYRIWARKEALIKVTGEGFAFALSSFSVPHENSFEASHVSIREDLHCTLQSFIAHPDYQSAYATAQSVTQVTNRQWKNKIL